MIKKKHITFIILLNMMIMFSLFPGKCLSLNVGFPMNINYSVIKIIINLLIMVFITFILILIYSKIKYKKEVLYGIRSSSIYIITVFIYFYFEFFVLYILSIIISDSGVIYPVLLKGHSIILFQPLYNIIEEINYFIIKLNKNKYLIKVDDVELILNKVTYAVTVLLFFIAGVLLKIILNIIFNKIIPKIKNK